MTLLAPRFAIRITVNRRSRSLGIVARVMACAASGLLLFSRWCHPSEALNVRYGFSRG